MHAVQRRSTGMAKLLLAEGANIDAIDRFGNTALAYAVETKSVGMTKLLIGKGADMNKALLVAVQNDSARMASLLLEMGANADATDGPYGDTPLMIAVQRGMHGMAKLLVEKGANGGREGETALGHAIRHIGTAAAKLLIEIGVDLDAIGTVRPHGRAQLQLLPCLSPATALRPLPST